MPARDATATTNGTVDDHPQPLASSPNATQSHDTPPAYAPPTPQSATTSPTNTVAPQTARDFSTPSKEGTGSVSQYAAAGLAAITSGTMAGATSESNHTANSTTSSVPITERAAEIYNSATQSVSNTVSETGTTLQQQLDSAKQTIISLKEQIQSQNLRQRQAASGVDIKDRSVQPGSSSSSSAPSTTTGVAIRSHTSDGVPVQMVAALCMLSFLIAYFFF